MRLFDILKNLAGGEVGVVTQVADGKIHFVVASGEVKVYRFGARFVRASEDDAAPLADLIQTLLPKAGKAKKPAKRKTWTASR